jgi:hypothetical protein
MEINFRNITAAFGLTIACCSSNAGYISLSAINENGTSISNQTIHLTEGDFFNFSLKYNFNTNNYYNQNDIWYYLPGYGGNIQITGYGTSGYYGYQGPMTFYNSNTDTAFQVTGITITDGSGNHSQNSSTIFEYINPGIFTVTARVDYSYISNYSYQDCGGSAWARWGWGGTLGWCTNPYSGSSSTPINSFQTTKFFVEVADVPSPVPEPNSMALVSTALLCLLCFKLRQKNMLS